MPTWEYAILYHKLKARETDRFELIIYQDETLSLYGSFGWDLISIIPMPKDPNRFQLIFKRPKK